MNVTSKSNGKSLGHMPSKKKWEFDQGVTNVFEDMLERSIPLYSDMRKCVYDIGIRFVKGQSHIIDLGCSKGSALEPFICKFGENVSYLGIDISQPMLNAARKKYKKQIKQKVVEISDLNLTETYPSDVHASLTLCVLTLQFIPVCYRQTLLENVYRSTMQGGALILVEKVRGDTPELDNMMIDLYHKYKNNNGYTYAEILAKKESLKEILIPLSSNENESLLKNAGFAQVDCFWRWMNFTGFVAVK